MAEKTFIVKMDESTMKELRDVMQVVDWDDSEPLDADVIKELFFIEDGRGIDFRDQVKVKEERKQTTKQGGR